MRRALSFFTFLVVAAVQPAAAQRATLVANLVSDAGGPPLPAVHISNLLSDPLWREDWENANFIQVHWKVQAWRDRFLGGSQPAVEWDVCVQQVPGLDVFNYIEHVAGRQTARTYSFRSLDSLRAELTRDVKVPLPRPLSRGSYYYLVDVHVSTASENPCDPRNATGKSGFLSGVMLSGPSFDLPRRTLPFTVP